MDWSKSDKEDESLNDNNSGSKDEEDEEEEESDGTWKSIEGNSQPVYYLLHKLTDKDLTVIATGSNT